MVNISNDDLEYLAEFNRIAKAEAAWNDDDYEEYIKKKKKKERDMVKGQKDLAGNEAILKIDTENQNDIKLEVILPKENFISKYIEIMSTMTSAYSEWHFAGAVSLLSVVANRKLVLYFKQSEIYTNTNFFGIGLSTVSKKTTAMKLAKKFLMRQKLDERNLPKSFSPEGFIDILSIKPRGYLWIDECGSLLISMNKDYMADARDLMCDLYENQSFYRKVRKEKNEIKIINPYVSQWLMTTPTVFRENTKTSDLTSGWLLRYLYMIPSYTTQWMDESSMTEGDIVKLLNLEKILERLKIIINNLKNPITMELSHDATDYYLKWRRKMEENVIKTKDEIVSAVLGRLSTYVIKLAMLFEFGEQDFKSCNNKIIKVEMITESCRLIEEYFLPVFIRLVPTIGWNEETNKLEKVLGLLQRNKFMSRSEIMRKCHLKSKDITEIIDTLIESEEITRLEKKTGQRNSTFYKINDKI